jgi:hypothetical protein
MGTRHLIVVVQNGETKVAQYGQWDGYRTGQGNTILSFLNSVYLPNFREAVERCWLLTEEEADAKIDAAGRDWPKKFPELSRDTSADLLQMILETPEGLGLVDTSSFAADSLFCEFAYVIDLDENVLEVYEGFQDASNEIEGRFAEMEGTNTSGYGPVSLVESHSLFDLPAEFTEEDE